MAASNGSTSTNALSLARLFGRPRLLVLAGRPHPVGELTVGDLAELDAFVSAAEGDPLEVLAPGRREAIEAEGGPAAWGTALAEACDRAEAGPPGFGSDRGRAALATAEGAILLVWLACRRHVPEFTLAAARALVMGAPGSEEDPEAPRISLDEFLALSRTAWAADPLPWLLQAVHPDERLASGAGSEGAGISWEQAICEVILETGLPLETIGRMTLSAFASLRRGGKPPEPPMILPRPGETSRELAARLRMNWARLSKEPEPESPP